MDINIFVYFFLSIFLGKFVFVDIFYSLYKSAPQEPIAEEQQPKQEPLPVAPVKKVEVKYEDKYLDKVRALPEDWIFTEDEKKMELDLFDEFKQKLLKAYEDLLEQLEEDGEEYDPNVVKEPTDDDVKEVVRNHVISIRTKALANSKIMEKTPLGNVVMFYNTEKGAFEYYSDSSIPYRYLEPVCRRYVLTFGCRPLYVDMEMELKKERDRLLKEKEEKEREKEEQEKLRQTSAAEPQKKNVFAKLKPYNQSTGHVAKGAPPKNSIPVGPSLPKVKLDVKKDPNEPVVLKNKSNMYSYLGRFSNFSILKKIDRKAVDKKYKMNFADFKRIQSQQRQHIF